MTTPIDLLDEPHKPQFPDAPNQARKAATVEEALAAAIELKPGVGQVRKLAKERRARLAAIGKMGLPPEDW
ncbi:hypothetical protein CCR95_10810 [Thiocystis minor]|uniref:hypothetical protein n=1 Tax=Thiocystis minor TaxID=61597 RepID=UPI0019131FAE|nr:hypothetical protein [Thiocystis minor]MBK5964561.1 hypothetical protein [Thiocystis minor]